MARGRGESTPKDQEWMQIISNNINFLLSEKGLTQAALSRGTGIPASTLTGYVKGTSLPIVGNIQKIADFFNVEKADLDPRFSKSSATAPKPSPLAHIANFDPNKAILLHNYDKLDRPRKNNLVATSERLLAEQEGKGATVTDINEKRAEYKARKRVKRQVPGKVSAGSGYWQEDDADTEVDFYADEIPNDDEYDTIAVVVGHSMEPKIKNGDFLFIKLADQVNLNQVGIFQVNGENYIKKLKEDRLESLNPDYPDIYPTEDDTFRVIGEVVEVYREG